jgi:hypothetical protein
MHCCKGLAKRRKLMSGGGLVRLGGVCGLLFVLLMVPAYVVGSPDAATPISGAREALGYFGTSAGNFVFSNGSLALLSAFFLWLLGVLYGVLRRAEGLDGVLSTVMLVGGVFFIILQCAGNTVEVMHPATAQRFVNFVPDPQLAFASLALSTWLYHFCQVGDAVMILATSLVVLGSGVLPRWLALVGFLAAILTFLHFLLPLVGAVSGLVWVALISALMLGGLAEGAQAPRRRARR